MTATLAALALAASAASPGSRPTPLWKLPSPLAPPPAAVFAYLGRFPRGAPRALAASGLMLGMPYREGPLGEGEGPDPAPRLRFDGADCQTFVEEAIALGEARGPGDLAAVLDDVRYGGPPAYGSRDHFVMTEWVPRNEAKGYVADATALLAGPLSRRVGKTVTALSWARRRRALARLPDAAAPLGRFTLPIVPLSSVLALAPRIPDGTVALVVRADRASYPDRVTHLGFIVHHGGRAFLRHASSVFRRVVDEPLDRFVARNGRYDGWPVEGLSLLSVRDGAARVGSLRP